VNELVQV